MNHVYIRNNIFSNIVTYFEYKTDCKYFLRVYLSADAVAFYNIGAGNYER